MDNKEIQKDESAKAHKDEKRSNSKVQVPVNKSNELTEEIKNI